MGDWTDLALLRIYDVGTRHCLGDTFPDKFCSILQARLLRGTSFVHETYGVFRTLEDLWDGEIWAIRQQSVFGRKSLKHSRDGRWNCVELRSYSLCLIILDHLENNLQFQIYLAFTLNVPNLLISKAMLCANGIEGFLWLLFSQIVMVILYHYHIFLILKWI